MASRKEEIESWNRYYAERCDIDKRALEIGGRYDKLALAVSGGGFALSITFLEKIAHAPPVAARVFLGISWFAFGLSILAQLFAMRYSSRALQLQIQDLDHSYQVESTGESSLA